MVWRLKALTVGLIIALLTSAVIGLIFGYFGIIFSFGAIGIGIASGYGIKKTITKDRPDENQAWIWAICIIVGAFAFYSMYVFTIAEALSKDLLMQAIGKAEGIGNLHVYIITNAFTDPAWFYEVATDYINFGITDLIILLGTIYATISTATPAPTQGTLPKQKKPQNAQKSGGRTNDSKNR